MAMPKSEVRIESEGMDALSDGFAGEVQSIEALAVFARALPGWCAATGRGISFMISCSGPEVSINMGMSEGATAEEAEAAMRRIAKVERMKVLEVLIDEMRNVGVDPLILDPMIAEAERLAHELFPKED